MSSYKNELQEYYQKQGSPSLPTYSHEWVAFFRTTGSEGVQQGQWLSTLTLPDFPDSKQSAGDDYPKIFQKFGATKRDADKNAAKMALEYLKSSTGTAAAHTRQTERKPNETNMPLTLKQSWLVLIDLENSPNHTAERWNSIRWENCAIEAFVGKLSSHAQKDLTTLYPFVTTFHVVDSGHKDAVDHAISVRAGTWLFCQSFIIQSLPLAREECFAVVSRDRFASALMDILRQQCDTNDLSAKIAHYTTIDSCFENLQ